MVNPIIAPAAVLLGFALLPGAARGVEFRVTERLTVKQGLEVSTSATASPLLFISSTTGAGNVGIGTTSPGAKLHMSSGTLLVDGNASTAVQVGVSSFIINSSGNVGIGTAIPGYKLDVVGDVRLSAELIYGNVESRTQTRDDAGLQGNAGAKSGFFETSVPAPAANWYPGASGWQHLLDIRHSNTVNNYAMQFAGSFFDQNLYFRKTNNSPATAWRRVVSEAAAGAVFSYTGADQSYTVPAGVTSITVKMWGAGGGGGNCGGWFQGSPGGAGGFTQGTIAVTPAQVLTVIVGQGGTDGSAGNATRSYGGGGFNCGAGADCRYSGKGGGRSAIRNGGTELMTAGGGGGGGVAWNDSLANDGGAGGGVWGERGMSDAYSRGGGWGGGQTVGGRAGVGGVRAAVAGTQFIGGNVTGTESYGGGGGGGWYGGGGGAYDNASPANAMSGGGGGSGYVNGAGVSNAVTIAGRSRQPPEMRDFHYTAGIGVGGGPQASPAANCTPAGGISDPPTVGGNGLVVISPN